MNNALVDVFYPEFCNRSVVAIDNLDQCVDADCCLNYNQGNCDFSGGSFDILSVNEIKKCFCKHSHRCEICIKLNELLIADSVEKVKIHRVVKQSGKYNFEGCRIIVNKKINGAFMRVMLRDYKDIRVVEFLEYGFPLGFVGDRMPRGEIKDYTVSNHAGANNFPVDIDNYLIKEASHHAIIGPFRSNPFEEKLFVCTVPAMPSKVCRTTSAATIIIYSTVVCYRRVFPVNVRIISYALGYIRELSIGHVPITYLSGLCYPVFRFYSL